MLYIVYTHIDEFDLKLDILVSLTPQRISYIKCMDLSNLILYIQIVTDKMYLQEN